MNKNIDIFLLFPVLKTSALFCVVFLLFAGCSQNESKSDEPEIPEHIQQLDSLTVFPIESVPRTNMSFEEEVRFGDTEEVFLGVIREVLVDNRGRVYLADSGWGHRGIHVYAPDGSFIKTMGGGGKGPGEFLSFRNVDIVADEIHLFDDDLDRINVYSLKTLEFSHARLLDFRNWNHIEEIESSHLSYCYFRSDGTMLLGFAEQMELENAEEDRLIRYYLMNEEGEVISDKVLQLKGQKRISGVGNTAFTLEYDRKSLLSLSPSDELITAWSEDFLLKWYDSMGNYQRAVYYPYQRTRIDREKVLTKYDHWENNEGFIRKYKRRIRSANLPELWPALESMLIDDQKRIWISTVVDFEKDFKWWVLDESGKLISKFSRPQNHSIMAVKNGYAYILIEEGGGEEVVRYSIDLTSF